jgi:GDP-L-fucose synthase
MEKNSRILIVGHNDVIERLLYTYLTSQEFRNVYSNSRDTLDVLNQQMVQDFFKSRKPEYVFLSSIRSGGIAANQRHAAEFIYENLECQNNVIHAAYTCGTKKLIFFNGSCTYPKECLQPMKEDYLLTGPLEETSEPYSVAKIAGVKLSQAYKRQYGFNAIVAVPATVYGPGSNADIETAHVMDALIGKFSKAVREGHKEVTVWGTGKPRREFLYVDDFVDAALFLMDHYDAPEMINVGGGYDVSIKELAQTIKEVSGFKGKIVFDSTKPDGTMRKLLDNSRIKKLGWKPKVDLEEGIKRTYEWHIKSHKVTRSSAKISDFGGCSCDPLR